MKYRNSETATLVWFIWIVVSLFVIQNVNATASTISTNYVLYENFNGTGNINGRTIPSGGSWVDAGNKGTMNNNMLTVSSVLGDGQAYAETSGTNNYIAQTCHFYYNMSAYSTAEWVLRNGATQYNDIRPRNTGEIQYIDRTVTLTTMTKKAIAQLNYLNEIWIETNINSDTFNFTMKNSTATVRYCTDCLTRATETAWTRLYFASESGGIYTISDLRCWNGTIADEPQAAPSDPTITLVAPVNNNVTNIDVNLTFSITNTNTDNCTLYDNRTGIWQSSSYTINGTVIGNYDFGKTGLATTEGKWLWGVICKKDGANYYSTTNRTIIVDLTYPTITLNPNNKWNVNNLSNTNPYNDEFLINITAIDDRDLYKLMVDVTKTGTTYFNFSRIITGNITYTFTNLTNMSAWQEGTYNIHVLVSDSHTAKAITNYDVKKSNNKLEFNTAENIHLWIETDDESITDSIKYADRYSTEFEFIDKVKKSRTFHVKSDTKIIYLQDSGYAAHFVIEKNGKGNWIDFETLTNPNYEVIKVNDYHYKVIFYNLDYKVKFNSVGSLNTYEVYYTWYRGNYSTLAPIGYAGETSILYLNVTNGTGIASANSTLVYNSVTYGSITEQITPVMYLFNRDISNPATGQNYTYYWTVSVTQSDGTIFTFNTREGLHEVRNWWISTCDASNSTGAVTFYLYDESSITGKVISNLEVNIQSWITSKNNYKNFSASYSGGSGYSICINKDQLYNDIYLKYYSSNSETIRYYAFNKTLLNNNQTINLYLINTTDTCELRLTTKDISYNIYPEVLGKLQRFYPSENVYRTVQMGLSGGFGLITFFVLENSVDYKLIFTDTNNNILKTLDRNSIGCTSGVLSLSVIIEPDTAEIIEPNIGLQYLYDNDTGIVSVYWSNPGGEDVSVTANIDLLRSKKYVRLCNLYGTGATGLLTCNVSGYEGTLYLSANSTKDGTLYNEISQFIQLIGFKLSLYIDKEEGSFWGFVIALPIVFVGLFSPVAAILSSILASIIIYYLGILSAMNISIIIVYMIGGIAIGLILKM